MYHLGEAVAELDEMAGAADERHSVEPLLLQRAIDPFGDRDAAVLAHGTEALLDGEQIEEVRHLGAIKATAVVRDEMLGWPESPQCHRQGVRDGLRAVATCQRAGTRTRPCGRSGRSRR